MTPAEFEWAQEQLEIAYERGEIGKLTLRLIEIDTKRHR